ncbi:hypothetical protein GCM10010392_66710 [Streptomyces clavifer]|nr:hypothetical protein GCM10010392_66710 [Streptomyces clavifer]
MGLILLAVSTCFSACSGPSPPRSVTTHKGRTATNWPICGTGRRDKAPRPQQMALCARCGSTAPAARTPPDARLLSPVEH